MPRYELIYANEEETKEFETARSFSGLSYDPTYKHLTKNQLANIEYERNFGKKNTADHRHLSLAIGPRKKLVRWSARSSNGYHYNYGAVMRIVTVS